MVDRKIPGAGSVDEVINQVLNAEHEARERVANCRAEAERIRTAAEERARAVAVRTEQRIQATHRIADQAVERVLAELRDRASRRADWSQDSDYREHLDRALDTLVDEMIGASR